MDTLNMAILGIVCAFLTSLLGIIHSNLNKKIQDNLETIKIVNNEMKTLYLTKSDLQGYKNDHAVEHLRQNTDIDKMYTKMDKIYDLLLEVRNNEK